MALEVGKFVKLKEPKWTITFGQGKHPKGMNINVGKKSYLIEWGKVLKVSETCDTENKIADLNTGDQYDSVHINFVKEHENQFEILK